MPKIDQSVVESAPIPISPLAEQEQIVAETERRLSINDELTKEVELTLQRAERFRQSILQRAFAGKLINMDTPLQQTRDDATAQVS